MKSISKYFLRASIESKIRWIVIITSSAMLFSAFGAFMFFSYIYLERNKEKQLQILHDMVSISSHNALIYRDYDSAIDKLDALRSDQSVLYACLYDYDGEEFAVYSRTDVEGISCPDPDKAKYGSNNFGREMDLYRDIFFRNEKMGSLYIRTDLDAIDDVFYQFVQYSVLAFLISLICGYLASSQMLKFVSNPIKSLLKTAKDVSENYNYSVRADKVLDDELGVLVDSFNHMLQQIHERDTEVVKAYEGLELRVIERTQQLEDARQAAEAANQAKTAFLTNMSHELRTPMHVVLSYSGFGIEEIKSAEREELLEYFTRINDSGARLLLLLNNILDLAKLESGKMVFDMRRSDLRQPVNTVLTELSNLLEGKSIRVIAVEPEEPPIAEFDMGKIIQVIYNLVSNAIKFTPENGTITISYKKGQLPSCNYEDDMVEAISLSIKDNGIGVPENEFEAVFDKFIQSSKTHTGAGGTGLGLAISKEIILEHNGKIWCENNETKGACFTFMLPVQREDVQ